MEWSKIFNPKEMNSFQFIALTGVIMSALAQLFLHLWGKEVESFHYLYLCWGTLFLFGTIQNLRHNPEDDHHHHHHH
ncbi:MULTISPECIES: hypothetical protein [Rufibacter]|uniref:Uncharacterized protein n=1 Tax=Rufibacter quisquiliarum TaxID=1549639 RepID=A0A839GSZ6_9BACT|nr:MULTISPECIES: hypothetical protein [Rufibacter]MBA9078605.1 hypothetical protein [Rufibacter quisquiliarum]